ncbi:MAG: CoA transferase [Desertimonas sp.]
MNQLNEHAGVLAGIKVVDTTVGLAGPVATRWLAELGADVLKIEPPGGDPTRERHPAAFASWNRSKDASIVDFGSASDRARFEQLLDQADVFVHGWTRRQGEALGYGAEQLTARWPSLIVASVTAYPADHPDAERFGDELLVQARVGVMDEQEALRDGPMFIRLPIANWGAAYLLAGGVLVRLLERERTGAARAIATSLMQGALAPAALYWQRAEHPPRWMAEHTLPKLDEPPHVTIFECADGRWLEVMGGFTKMEPLRPILDELGSSDLFGERATVDNRDRWAEVFARHTVEEWTDLLWPVGALCMPILDVGEVLGIEQAVANGYSVEVDDVVYGATRQAAAPFEVNGPPIVRGSAPEVPDRTVPVGWALTGAPPSAGPPSGRLPLDGLRILDFGSYVAGPFGSQCLADFGAEVIKVEPLGGEKGREINQFTGCQRGKRSVALDLRHPQVAAILERLVSSADVVMHNVRLAASRKMGIDEESIRRINPNVVFAHSSGYGTAGPWSELPAFDPTGFAVSGWAHGISGAGQRPSWLRMSAMDCMTGLANFVGVAAALVGQRRLGGAGRADTSLLATATTFASETLLVGPDMTPARYPTIDRDQTGVAPWCRIFEVADGWVAVSACTASEREAMARVFGAPPARFGAAVRGRTTDQLVGALEHAGVPVERVALDHRDALFDRELATGSGLVRRSVGTPYGWFENPGGFWSAEGGVVRNDEPIPAIGAHTAEVLVDLGFSVDELEELRGDGVIGMPAEISTMA